MSIIYQPANSILAKISRKTLDFRARRILKFKTNKPIVSFTFDDFPRTAISNGARVLEREGWRASFYVAAGLEGVKNHHGQNFFASDLPALEAKGHEIAGHTFSHMDCAKADISEVLADIERNRIALKAMGVKADIRHFAYPFGEMDLAIKSALGDKFASIRGIKTGVMRGQADLNALRSYGVYSDATFNTLLGDIETLKAKPGWITVFAHDIRKNPSQWGCTPEDFLRLVETVKNSGAKVLPIGQALKLLEGNYEQ